MEALQLDVHSAKFDLTLNINDQKDRFLIEFEYSLDLFDASYIERLATHFENLLRGVTSNIDTPLSSLPMLSEHERRELLVDLNNTNPGIQDTRNLVELFEAQVQATPQNTAIIDQVAQSEKPRRMGSVCLYTYQDVNDRANQLARLLRDCGVRAESLIGICAIRSADLVISILAVLKAGAAYLPLDPNYPRSRNEFMLKDAEVGIVFSHSSVKDSLGDYAGRIICLDTDAADWHSQPIFF